MASPRAAGALGRGPAPTLRTPLLPWLGAMAAATAAGGAVDLLGRPAAAGALWAGSAIAGLLPLSVWLAGQLRHRRVGVDLIAWIALVAAVVLGEQLAGAVIAVMVATGRVLDWYAAHRAQRELRLLVDRAPRIVHRREDLGLTTLGIGEVTKGMRLLVQPGEVVPVDGLLTGGPAVLDESALTGESRPVRHRTGDLLPSGIVNAGQPFEMITTGGAEQSTYAGIVRLAEQAQRDRAPFVRLADRYAAGFVPLALLLAGLAWVLDGDPVRALAVLVVATPCPLLIAAPVAMVAGMSRAAERGVVVKSGAALEQLALARQILFDKTGTLTTGRPAVVGVVPAPEQIADSVLRAAAAVDQVSSHVLAQALVEAARGRGLDLPLPEDSHEAVGLGVEGIVEGRRVRIGRAEWAATGVLPSWAAAARASARERGISCVYVAVDDRLAGCVHLADQLRPEAAAVTERLRRSGIPRQVMITGDRRPVAERVARHVGVDAVRADMSPEDKIEAVREARSAGPVIMVGDGLNDAPALAAADVGVAMGARGASASSETADVVVLVDRLDRLVEVRAIATRTRRIARQSVMLGMGLSAVAMGMAAAGLLDPVPGAFLQEAIDLVAIASALRALRGGGSPDRPVGGPAHGWRRAPGPG